MSTYTDSRLRREARERMAALRSRRRTAAAASASADIARIQAGRMRAAAAAVLVPSPPVDAHMAFTKPPSDPVERARLTEVTRGMLARCPDSWPLKRASLIQRLADLA